MRHPGFLPGSASSRAAISAGFVLLAVLTACVNDPTQPDGSSGVSPIGHAPALSLANDGGGSGLRFDGIDDYVDLGRGPQFYTHTIEAWVRAVPVVTNGTIVGPGGGDVNGCTTGMGLSHIGSLGGERFSYVVGRFGCRNDAAIISPPVTAGVWHHLAGTWDASSMRFYVDGNLVGSQSLLVFDPFDRLLIGAYWQYQSGEHPEGFFPGDINEIRLWNYARTQAEIRQSACLALSGSEPGLIGYWRLDEGSGQMVFDASPTGSKGRLGSNPDLAGDAADPRWVSAEVHPCLAPPDVTPPVLTLPGDITRDATSPSGTVVYYSATASDDSDPSPPVTCAPPPGSNFPIGTTPVTCTARDASGNSTSGGFQVSVKGAAAQLEDLVALVRSFGLPHGIENSLVVKAQNSLAAVNAGNLASACGPLQAFISEAAGQSGKALTAAQANQLMVAANRIKAVLGCP